MSDPIRILHTESSKNMGGQELRILLEMEKMHALGFESVLAARSGTPILAEAERRGLRAYPIPMHNRLDPVSMAKLWRLMRRENIDVVNAHGSRDAWVAFLVARLLGIRTVRSRHVANPIRRHRVGQMIYGSLCDKVVTTSESIREGLIERGVPPEKIVSVPTGVDVEKYSTVKRDGSIRKELGIPENARLIGMISVLRGDKGPDVFLDACNRLLTLLDDAWCVLAGDGWMREQLEAQRAVLPQRDRIVLAGYRRDIPQLLAELDVLVLAARIPEGVPQVILQAHAAHVPVVATRVGGISEVAREGETAFTAQPNDPDSLVAAMRSALEERPLAEALAARGHALVIESYSIEAMLGRMADIYRNLISHNNQHHSPGG
jgi:glycosyltransferase involved in cell wall biosynthesis